MEKNVTAALATANKCKQVGYCVSNVANVVPSYYNKVFKKFRT